VFTAKGRVLWEEEKEEASYAGVQRKQIKAENQI